MHEWIKRTSPVNPSQNIPNRISSYLIKNGLFLGGKGCQSLTTEPIRHGPSRFLRHCIVVVLPPSSSRVLSPGWGRGGRGGHLQGSCPLNGISQSRNALFLKFLLDSVTDWRIHRKLNMFHTMQLIIKNRKRWFHAKLGGKYNFQKCNSILNLTSAVVLSSSGFVHWLCFVSWNIFPLFPDYTTHLVDVNHLVRKSFLWRIGRVSSSMILSTRSHDCSRTPDRPHECAHSRWVLKSVILLLFVRLCLCCSSVSLLYSLENSVCIRRIFLSLISLHSCTEN